MATTTVHASQEHENKISRLDTMAKPGKFQTIGETECGKSIYTWAKIPVLFSSAGSGVRSSSSTVAIQGHG